MAATESVTSRFVDDPFSFWTIPLGDWVESGVEWLVQNYRPFFQSIKIPIDWLLSSIEGILQYLHPLIVLLAILLLSWQFMGIKRGLLLTVGLGFIGVLGAWSQAMTTIAVVCTSVVFCTLIGVPIGILMAKSDRVEQIVKPVLDAMQTTPAFSYLVPVVMLFGVGKVPGTIVTIIFAVAPLVRLTNLGIRNVRPDVVEAAIAFGASPAQLLFKVQLPLATWTIMAGFNQSLMLALSMSVIAAMIAVGGLGQLVLKGIGRLDIGLAVVGATTLVILAVCLDRLTQSMLESGSSRSKSRLKNRGPVRFIRKMIVSTSK